MYEFWKQAEFFYGTVLPIVAIIFFMMLIVGLFIFYYTTKDSKKRKIMGGLFLTVFVGTLVFSVWEHIKYQHWIEQSAYVNPGVRNQREIMGSVVLEDPKMALAYQKIDLREQYSQLDMYRVREESRELSNRYLGLRDNRHYFTLGSDERYAFWYTGDVEFTNETTHITGVSFELNDDRFEQLGFTPSTPNYLETIYINQEAFDQAEQDIPSEVFPFSEAFTEWITS